MVVDSTFDSQDGKYSLTEVHHAGSGQCRHTIRVRVQRDHYERQSVACAEVLTPELTWTVLVTTPAGDWYPATPFRGVPATLVLVAADLVERAERVLAPR
jgi:hypothetical protein